MDFDYGIKGDKAIYTLLEELPAKVIERVDSSVGMLTLKLSRLARQKVSGSVLKSQTGKLRDALVRGTQVQKRPGGIKGRVGLMGASKKVAIYGNAQEYGATIQAHLLESKNAAAMRFKIGGRFVFAKSVMIPPEKIPEHSFLRSALREMKGEIESALEQAGSLRGII